MSSIVISGNTSGSVTLSAPDAAGSTTQTLVGVSGTLAPLVSGTAIASTSGTTIDFTGIPSWAKRITVMFSNVSLSAGANFLVRLGAGSIVTTGYVSSTVTAGGANSTVGRNSTAGFIVFGEGAANALSGCLTLLNISGNNWVASGAFGNDVATYVISAGGRIALSGPLDRLQITSTSTDTFDAGTINIMYE